MKKIVSLLVIFIMGALMLPGCTRVGSSMNGSGNIVDTDLQVTDFSSLNIKGSFIVEVVQSNNFKVTLSTDDNLIKRVKVSLERKTLNLSIEAPATFFPTSLKLTIGMPQLDNINLADSASATVSGFKDTDKLMIFLSGKSFLKGDIEVDTIELNLTEASEILLKGKAETTSIDAKGISKLDLSEFESTNAQVKMTEASQAIMKVLGLIDITLQQASKFYYIGNPIFHNTVVSGGSSMSHQPDTTPTPENTNTN